MTNTYRELVNQTSKYFPDFLDDESINNDLYETSIKLSQLPPYLNNLPKNLLSNHLAYGQNKNKLSILDNLRSQYDSQNLGLPEISTDSSQLTLYDNNNSKYNELIEVNENAFANPNIVPENSNDINEDNLIDYNWKLDKVVLGHTGQVCSVTMDPFNSFYVTGSSDKTIKFWDLSNNKLQLTLSGHIMSITDLKISDRHPYLFSCSEDKTIKCWDLEKNQIIRNFHGHLSSIYSIDLHPELNLLFSGGRDSSIRVWDIRTRYPIHILNGHKNSINKIIVQNKEPQIMSCSMDSTVKSWDLVSGKCNNTLTFHSKSIRAFILNDETEEIVTSSSDGIKKFKLPNFKYLKDYQFWNEDQHNVVNEGNLIINTMSIHKESDLIFSGCEDGKFGFWNFKSGKMFQNDIQIPIPGSLDSENGILCSTFDQSGERLVTGNVDKSIRVWKKTDDVA